MSAEPRAARLEGRAARLWIEVEDLFHYVTNNSRPSGIQRLAFELHKALRRLGGADRVRFLRHDPAGPDFREVAWEEVLALFDGLVDPPAPRRAAVVAVERPVSPLRARMRRALYAMPVPLRIALIRCGRAQLAALRSQVEALRGLPAIIRAARDARRQPQARLLGQLAALAGPGDVLAVLGSPWFGRSYADRLDHVRRVHGMRVMLLFYDLVPIRHPEWTAASVVADFTSWTRACLPMADILLAISRATAADVARYAAEQRLALPGPVHVVPIGTGFGERPTAEVAAADLPTAGSYVLFVSTLEARKNHALMVRVWRRLLEELPEAEVPTLVFAGRIGWLVQDLLQQLQNAAWLGGKVRLIEGPSDADLVQLYRGCLFTVFPSLHEGWGLPVSESLAFGKPCIVADDTSLPEAGGDLARYFDPDNLADAVRVICDTLADRAGLAAWQARVERDFRPVSWDEGARAILEHLP